ncbi:hypothetical protein DTO164E3_7567 [Paecilomyces variotii]|nr:hypothetical protein DTO164E3_7567 [Paecilomyces variotii]KAJ9221209.1 hypothetical protein DTO169C6_6479 [Paecilomyces variotii]KAJ9385580.1 hypothetical protein DTO063F5_4173 [Paecilomyces variotii]KAJ9397687.1 hypothetical protein DTO282F9_5366 [Paecilomyces variotii]
MRHSISLSIIVDGSASPDQAVLQQAADTAARAQETLTIQLLRGIWIIVSSYYLNSPNLVSPPSCTTPSLAHRPF